MIAASGVLAVSHERVYMELAFSIAHLPNRRVDRARSAAP